MQVAVYFLLLLGSLSAVFCLTFLSTCPLHACLVIPPSQCPHPVGPSCICPHLASLFAFGPGLDVKPLPTAARPVFFLLFLLTTLLLHSGGSRGGIHALGLGKEDRKEAEGPGSSLKHILTSPDTYLPGADLHRVSQYCNQCGLGGVRDMVNCKLLHPLVVE